MNFKASRLPIPSKSRLWSLPATDITDKYRKKYIDFVNRPGLLGHNKPVNAIIWSETSLIKDRRSRDRGSQSAVFVTDATTVDRVNTFNRLVNLAPNHMGELSCNNIVPSVELTCQQVRLSRFHFNR